MLKNTFCHIPGIGPKSEQNLWSMGVRSWQDVLAMPSRHPTQKKYSFLKSRVIESVAALEQGDAKYFADSLPVSGHWRIFSDFRDSVAYLDIETNGLAGSASRITTIAMYDGDKVHSYVKDTNLGQFIEDIQRYKVLVTYNGRCFDVPVIESHLGIRLRQAHIDLRFVLKSLGYTGGLKGCEKKLGLHRDELDGVDGYFAVLLWNDFIAKGNDKALDTLLAYNILDAVNLEHLMIEAYNIKIASTPFADTHRLPPAPSVSNPFKADIETVNRLMPLRWEYGH